MASTRTDDGQTAGNDRSAVTADLFAGPGEVRAHARTLDWGATPLGWPEAWSPALRIATRAMLDAPFPICLWSGPEYALVYNEAYRRILGAKHPTALGQPGAVVWAEIWEALEAQFAQVRAGGPPIAFENARFVMARLEGGGTEDAWFSYSLSALRDEDGSVAAVVNISPETTRQVRAERALEVERTRLVAVFQQSPSFVAVLRGPDNVFEFVNAAYEQIVGQERAVLGRPLFDALPEARGQGFDGYLAHVRATGEPLVFRDLPVLLDRTPGAPREERFVDITYLRLVEADGTQDAVIAHGTDVTEQVRARRAAEAAAEALTKSEARYRSLAEAVPVQVWTARPDGQIDFVSERAAAYFGVDTDALLGGGWGQYVHPDDLAVALDRWRRALATGEPYETEFRLRAGAGGGYRWHIARAVAERDASGAVVGWAGSNTDVHAERVARAEAEAANRAKSEFLAVMSHELRTPLNAIGGYAELLELEIRGPITEPQRADLARIRRAQRHLLGLINGVLNYAKVDAGAVDYHIADVPLAEVLAGCEALVAPQADAKALTLASADGAGLVVRADREKVQQIVLNLLSNAVKFTGSGGHIAVRCTADADRVAVRVADTGRGIAADQLERVFQPFVQVDARLTRTEEGTGLGLAISRELARAMGGDLTAESALRVGSTFTLTLPRA
jgi:PAS domain S-box-containing protein